LKLIYVVNENAEHNRSFFLRYCVVGREEGSLPSESPN